MNRELTIPDTGRKLRAVVLSLLAVSAMVGYYDAEARGGGGGGRGGGGGGGRMAGSSVSGANRSAPRPSNSSRPSSGSSSSSRPSTGGTSGSRPNSGTGTGTGSGNRGDINGGNRGDVGSGNRTNNGNVNIGNDINVDIDGGYGNGWGGGWGYHHPIAAGAFIGAVAVTTAAVMGSYYYGLPSGCNPYYYNSMNYHHCGSVYYQQTMSGADVVYVVVADPN